MNHDNLKTFIKFAENNCDTNCHGILGLNRSTLWIKISALESELNAKLVNRKKRHNSLTEAGQTFLKHAIDMVELYDRARSDIHKGEYHQGEIKISITQAMARGWLLPGLKDFLKDNKDYKLNIVVSDHLPRDVEISSDILFRPIAENSNFTRHWHIKYHHGLYASKEYLEEKGTPKNAEDLKNHTVLSYGTYPYTYFEDINWHTNGLHKIPRLSPKLQINATPGLFELATLGLGIISAPEESMKLYKKTLVRVLPDIQGPTIKTYFATNPNLFKSTSIKIEPIKKFIEKHLKKYVPIEYEF